MDGSGWYIMPRLRDQPCVFFIGIGGLSLYFARLSSGLLGNGLASAALVALYAVLTSKSKCLSVFGYGMFAGGALNFVWMGKK